jgi:hypothetical protein
MKKPLKYTMADINNLKQTIEHNYNQMFMGQLFNTYSILGSSENLLEIHKDIKNARKTTKEDVRKHFTVFYNIVYRYNLEQLIPYLNSEFEPIIYWRYSLGK